ncbi:serine protease inhibitor I/II-like [Schistocerca gregaria]|uniref:serine protease inhibitor I/II-like n=1 Tax=Schistocerca gregaria TaxID=7010 RepID=UPI00211DAA5B|nr:serine protease inhibitor I/II-like [Schistocerca gregaria]
MKLALSFCAVFLLLVALAQANQGCIFGQTKSEDCNACICSASSEWICTGMQCRAKRDISCEPGVEFTNQCYSCKCGPDGSSASCTNTCNNN